MNEDGSLSEICLGTCAKPSAIQIEEQFRYNTELRFEKMFLDLSARIEKHINSLVNSHNQSIDKILEIFKKGFLEGMEEESRRNY